VDVHRFCESKTNRNFALNVPATIDMRLGARPFAEILAKVHFQVRHELDIRTMKRHIARNVRGGRIVILRVVPLFIKVPFMRMLHAYYGTNSISGFVSNMGPTSLPASAAARVEELHFVGAPSTTMLTGASVLSWKDRLFVGFGSLAVSRELERLFFSRLQALDIPVRVECNFEE